MKGRSLIKRLASFLLAAYVVVAGFNYVTTKDVPQETTYIIQTEDGRGNGSGVLIAPGVLLTAAHVASVNSFVPLYVKYEGILHKVKVKSIDHISDLALLEVEGLNDKTAAIASSVPSIGSNVVATGYPMNKNIQAQLTTEGKVLGVVEDRLMSSAPILPGNSGGGLFQRNWLFKYELVGITVSVPMIPIGWSGIPAFHINNAVATHYIWRYLHDNGF